MMPTIRFALSLLAVVVVPRIAAAQAAARDPLSNDGGETAAIIAAARNYIDGFAHGDTARMRRAVHPDLAKRLIVGRAGSPPNMTADALVRGTAGQRDSGVDTPADSIRILDQYKDMAMVRIGADRWVDYVHMARFGDTWQIINVAWQLRATPPARQGAP